MEEIFGRRGSSIYVYQNYIYNIDKRNNKIFRCNTRKTTKCSGAVKIVDGKEIMIREHDYESVEFAMEISHMKQEMLSLCRETFLPAKEIFDSVCRKYLEAAAHVTFSSLKSILNFERMKTKPKIPTSLFGLTNLIIHYEPIKEIYVATVEDQSECAIMFSSNSLMELLASSKEIFIDRIFAVLPSTPTIAQLYSIHTRYMDTGIATMFVLCSSCTSKMYDCMWKKILELTPQLKTNLEFVMTDFEKAATNAVKANFPQV